MVRPLMAGRGRAGSVRNQLIAAVWLGLTSQAGAVSITIDYSYDTNNFFGAGNPSGATAGAQAKAAVEAVAGFYSSILADDFLAVTIPPDYQSQTFNGVQFWDTSLQFTHPSMGGTVVLNGEMRAADEYRIYIGARDLGGSTLGDGDPTPGEYGTHDNGGNFTQ